jgi:hypothetical protein
MTTLTPHAAAALTTSRRITVRILHRSRHHRVRAREARASSGACSTEGGPHNRVAGLAGRPAQRQRVRSARRSHPPMGADQIWDATPSSVVPLTFTSTARQRGLRLRSERRLVTRLSDQFQLDVPLEEASWACREAIAGMDWDLESIEPHRLDLRRRMLIERDPAYIQVVLSGAGPDAATVRLEARDPWGFGRWDRRNLGAQMNSLRNAIEVAARRSKQR